MDGLIGDRVQCVGGELQFHTVHLEQTGVLLHQGVLGSGQDLDQRFLVQVSHRGDDRETADELRDQTELDQVLGHHLSEVILGFDLGLGLDLRTEAQAALADPVGDDLLQARERTRHNEQHVGGVDLDELLVRVLAPALGRHRSLGTLQDLQQCLLDTLAGDVPGDRRVLALAGDLVDLVDVDDSGLSALDVVVGGLDQLEQNVLDILAHVAGLGQRGGVGDGERNIEHLGQRLGQVGLTAAGGPEHQDIGFGQLNRLGAGIARFLAGLNALVVVVHRDRQCALGGVLTDDVILQELADLGGLGQLIEFHLVAVGELLFDDLVAQVDALVADVDAGARDELLNLLLALPTERAFQQVTAISDARHGACALLPSPSLLRVAVALGTCRSGY